MLCLVHFQCGDLGLATRSRQLRDQQVARAVCTHSAGGWLCCCSCFGVSRGAKRHRRLLVKRVTSPARLVVARLACAPACVWDTATGGSDQQHGASPGMVQQQCSRGAPRKDVQVAVASLPCIGCLGCYRRDPLSHVLLLCDVSGANTQWRGCTDPLAAFSQGSWRQAVSTSTVAGSQHGCEAEDCFLCDGAPACMLALGMLFPVLFWVVCRWSGTQKVC
jgi:hypothetical protein